MKNKLFFVILISIVHLSRAQNTFPTTGNVGIGTVSPGANLDVVGNGRFSTGILSSEVNTFEKVFTNATVFENGITNSAVDIRLGNLSFWGYIEVEITSTYNYQNSGEKLTKLYAIGTNPNNNIYINESRVSDAMGTITDNISLGDFSWDSVNNCFKIPVSHIVSTRNNYTIKVKMFTDGGGAKAVFDVISISPNYTLTALPRNYVYFNNNVGIGTSNPTSKLTVAGNINAREVKVTVDAGADFVFEKEYHLPSLSSLDTYIKENKHLPEIASAKEMEVNGINLSEMNIKLLQKMEEMTLYIIQQDKEIKAQAKEITAFKNVFERLSKIEEKLESK